MYVAKNIETRHVAINWFECRDGKSTTEGKEVVNNEEVPTGRFKEESFEENPSPEEVAAVDIANEEDRVDIGDTHGDTHGDRGREKASARGSRGE